MQNVYNVEAEDDAHRIVPVLSCVLSQLCMRNDKLPLDPDFVTKFHAMRPPAISIREYLDRIAKYSLCSNECFVLALIYIDRIIQNNQNFTVTSLNVHRLLITSLMLSAKFFDDQYFNNAYYAKVGGVPCSEVNSLEVEFLFMINFSLFVDSRTYQQYKTELSNHVSNATCSCPAQYPVASQPTLANSSSHAPIVAASHVANMNEVPSVSNPKPTLRTTRETVALSK